MAEIEIYWNDLKEEKRKEILRCLGENGNFDVIPIVTIPYENDLARLIYEEVYVREFISDSERVGQEPVCFEEFLDNEWENEECRRYYLDRGVVFKVIDEETAQASMSNFSEPTFLII